MIAQDHLFRLIKALKATEKQAFTRLAARKGGDGPLYLQLFHALNALKEYHEPTFLASKAGIPFAANYAVQKVELFEKILLMLRAQRQSGGKQKPVEFRVREYMEDARLLRAKKLPELAEKRLNQAMEEAERYHLHEVQLELLRMQRASVMRQVGLDDYSALEALHRQITHTAAIVQNKARMLQLLDPLFLQAKHQAALSGRLNLEMIEQVMSAPELNDVTLCLSFEAEQNYHFCHAIYHQLHNRAQEAWIHGRAIYLAWQENPAMRSLKGAEYRNVVNNYLGYCINASRFDDFENALATIMQGPFNTQAEQVGALHSVLAMELQKHFSLCDWNAADKVMQRYKDRLDEFSEHLSPSRMMLFYLSFSRLKLIQKKWKEAARWAKNVIDEGEGKSQLGMVFQARLQELIALYELGDIDKLNKRYRSAVRSFQRADFTEEFERKALETIQRLPSLSTQKEVFKTFQALEATLESAGSNLQDAITITSAWTQSHLRGISIAEVLEEIKERQAMPPA